MSLNLSNGNVGIGTTGPQELLHVGAGGDASFTSEIDLIVTRAGPSGMSTRNSTADVETFMFAEAAQGIVGTATNHPFQLRTNNAAVMTLTTSGNVGIGTTSPTFKLDVAGSGYFSSSLFAGGAITGTSTLNITGLATFVSASTTNVGSTGSAYFATSNGNVGIGTTGPVGKLDIITGAVTAVGALASSGIHIGEAGDVNRIAEISLGWSNGGANTNAPASLGFITTSATGQTKGALYFATRDVTTDTAPTERMRIQSNGNVGIGTTGPGTQLDIVNDGGVADGIRVGNNRTNTTRKFGGLQVAHYTNSEEDLGLIWGDNNTSSNDIYIGGGTSSFNAATSINFYTAANSTTVTGTNRMVIDSGGNVGIGTTAPGELLEVNGSGDKGILIKSTGSGIFTIDGTRTGDNDVGQFNVKNSGTILGSIFVDRIDEDDSGRIRFRTTNVGTAGDRMIIAKDGNVGIGTTGPNSLLHLSKNEGVTSGEHGLFELNNVGNGGLIMGYRANGTDVTGGYLRTPATMDLSLGAGAATQAIFVKGSDGSGNVGIGTTSPTFKLDVAGFGLFFSSSTEEP